MAEQEKVQCPECEAPESVGRRQFITMMGGTAVTLAGLELIPKFASAQGTPAPRAAKPAEALIRELYEGLTERQRTQVVKPFDHRIGNSTTPARLGTYNQAIIPGSTIGVNYTAAQKELNQRILRAICADDEGYVRISRNGSWDNSGSFENCGAYIFGDPTNNRQFAWVFTGHHLTVRCDGNSEPNAGFGGTMYYGHSTDGMSRRNVWFYQTSSVLSLWDALSEAQRRQATLTTYATQQDATSARHRQAPYPGLKSGDMTADQRRLVQQVMRDLLSPYRREDVDEIMDLVRRNGGMDQIHLGFFRERNTPEGRWGFWRLEGPGFVWNYRIHDHVHCWVNVALAPQQQRPNTRG